VISFTGSTRAGRIVGKIAGEHLKRAHLELGGNNALVVLPGADLAKAASAGAFGSFMHQGQICMTTRSASGLTFIFVRPVAPM
jgi:benzaldehyde dehydrogenase (NAD)